ncbi:meprin A subunit beta [Arapaima gigas]
MIHCITSLVFSLFCHQIACLPTSPFTEFDEDRGLDLDIFHINEAAGLDLFEGDIVYDENQEKNSILGDKYRWPTTVPYYLEDSLEINAKGVVLKAFEQYRLKTCIDFKPWEGEQNYISVFKGSGCFSSVGNRRVGKQQLSIGSNCDHIATVEHEFFHALGFWHEQSRSDRDDYVTVVWNQISAGKEHNFNKYSDAMSSSLNVPYDFASVMHYSKTAFQKGSEPTIVTKIPEFLDVIGQRMDFSHSDLLKLNRLYNCTTSSTFLDSCSFEQPNICGMIQTGDTNAAWTRVTEVPAGPPTDYTKMGDCKGSGYFMHFSMATGAPGEKAYLESRLFYPTRGYQCLQFYYYHSGSNDDQLNVWVQEFDDTSAEGALRHIAQIPSMIPGQPDGFWQLHHVSLDVKKKFRVVFEGTKGLGQSLGGLSIDDINLSETKCPEHVWHIKGFEQLLDTTPPGKKIYSPRFVSSQGYSFQVGLYLNGKSDSPGKLGMYVHLTSGDKDDMLQWPCPWKQATVMLLDQNPDIRLQMSKQRSITTDPEKFDIDENGNRKYFWDDPRKVGSLVSDPDGSRYYRGPGRGTSSFLSHAWAKSRDFIKGGDAIFIFTMDDVSKLLETQPLPRVNPCSLVRCDTSMVCMMEKGAPVCRRASVDEGQSQSKASLSPGMLMVAVVGSVCMVAALAVASVSTAYVMKYRRMLKQQETTMVVVENVTNDTEVITENPTVYLQNL